MPTSTFFNLPATKQQRIIKAAIEEFSQYCFSHASINRIIKGSEIPRGSFYQYFHGKEDLYLYLMEQIGKEKLEVFARHKIFLENQSFFEVAKASMPAILEWVAKHPDYNKIGMLMTRDGSDFIRHITKKMDSRGMLTRLLQEDQDRGLIRSDIDPALVAQMYLAMVEDLLSEFYLTEKPDQAMEKAVQMLDILGMGILTRKEKVHEQL
ncbi:MAG: TetR/AcrR family transcriptional regulator [Angelakisella sp.]|nr:TetR/AcrR family transcriptional regulator [Angelakisella sp.]